MKNFSLNQLSTNNRALCIVNSEPTQHHAFQSLKSIFVIALLLCAHSVWGGGWTRVTSVSELTAGGTFIMGYEASANSGVIVPMQNTGTATTSAAGLMYSGTSDGSSGSGTITMSTVTETSKYEVTIAASSSVNGAITIKCGSNYLGNTDTKNNCKLFTTEAATTAFTPTVGTNNVFTLTIAANTTYTTLQYNTGSPRFAVYTGGQQNVVFYKKGSDCTSTLTTPSVTATGHNQSATLSWPNVQNATKYQVSWNGGAYADASSPYEKSGLTNGTEYSWKVKAIGNGSTICDSEEATGTVTPNVTYTDYLTECSSDPSISVSPTSISGLGYVYGSAASASTVKTFTVTGSYLESNKVTVTAPTGFEVKTSTGNFADEIELTPDGGSINETISVRLSSGKTVNTYNGNVTVSCSGAGLSSQTVAVSATVTAAKLTTPSVTATPSVHQITLSWDAVANASSYQLVWDGGSPETINSTSVVKDNLIGGSNHTYSIVAVGSGNYSSSDAATGNATAGKESFTVTFKNNGVTLLVGGTRNVEEGAEIGALPVLTSSDACDEIARTFVGWSAQEITEKTATAPTLISATTTVSTAITYNAVWAEGGSDYVKTTSDKLISGGKVVMVHNASGTNYALSSNSSTTNYLNRYSVSITNSTITSPATEIVWNVSISSSSYKFDQGSTKKLNETSSGLYANSTDDSWTISTKNSSYELQGSNNSQYIDYWGSDGFTKYASSHNDNTIDFYVPSNTNFITKCPTTGYVTYNANDATSGSVPVDATEYTFGTTVTVKTNSGNLTKDHYDFAGWNTKADGTGDTYSAVAPLGTFTITKNTTLYAKWTPKTYQVTWSINGDDTDKSNVEYNNKVSAMHADPESGACDGKVFRGWVTSPIDGEQADAPSGMFTDVAGSPTITDNTTFYAVFAASSGSGTVFEDALNISGTNSISSRTGWSALNQAYGGNGSIRLASGNNAGYMTTNALSTMSGTATISFKIKGYAGNELGPMTLSVENGEEGYVLSQSSFSATSSTDWTDCSCTLAGAGTSAQLDFYATAGNRIYIKDVLVTCGSYSNYSTSCATLYTITFDGNGGTPAVESVKQTMEGGSVTLTTATRDGYNFNGWWTATSGGTKVGDANASYTPSGNETVHAQWTPITYTVAYDKNDANATGSTASSSHTYDVAKNLTSNGYSLAGHTFAGWATTSDGAVVYSDGQSVTNLSSTAGATVTLYAKWTANTHSLTWVTDGDALTGEYTHGDAIAYGTTIVAPNTPTKTGYTFAGWSDGSAVVTVAATMPDNDVTYTATWTPNPNTAYTVNHYKQNLDGTYPSEAFATDNLTGETGASVTPDVKTGDAITGFTAPSTQTVTILADGSLVVTYNYTRNTYTLTWALAGGDITTPGTAAGLVKYGATLTAPIVTKAGSTFTVWTPNVPATMPADNVTYTATWSANDNFHNGETIFFRSQGSDNQSAWWYGACVKAWFHNTSSEAAPTAWLNDGSGYKMFYTIVPSTGDFSELQVQRFADNCSDWWGEAGDLTQSGRNGKNTIASWRTTDPETFHAAWHDDIYALKVRGSIDSWAADQISLTDAGAGVFTGSMSHKATANTSEEFRVRDSEGVYFGTDGNSNNNTTLSGMTIGSTYTINASFALATRVLTITKTITAATITFDMQGHGEQVSPLVDQPAGQPIAAPATPTATGYEFTGWYTDPSCTQAWNFSDPITESMTLYAGWLSTTFVNYRTSCMIKVKTPTFSPAAGSYECAQDITITCATAGAAIYYTTDGSNPTTSSSVYTAPFSLKSSATVKAIAIKDGMTNSDIASAEYTIITQCPTPTISPASKNFDESVEVTISSDFDGTIYYTTDGGDPTTSSDVYSGPFTITETATVKAMVAKGSCLLNSEIVSATYNKNPRYTVTWHVGNGTSTTEVITGHQAVLPANPEGSAIGSCANTFMGWSATEIGTTPQVSAPGDLFSSTIGTIPTITAAVDYYAVFATNSGTTFNMASAFGWESGNVTLQESTEYTNNGYTITVSKGENANNTPIFYGNDNPQNLRIYGGNTMTISSGSAMTNIVLTVGAKAENNVTANVGTLTGGAKSATSGSVVTWTGNSNSVTFTWDGTSGNSQYTQIAFGGSGGLTNYLTKCCANTITITKGAEANGSFTLSPVGDQCIEGGSATATVSAIKPDDHYHFVEVTATVGDISGPVDGVYTISNINANTTIGVTFAEDAKHAVNWYVAGEKLTSGSQTTELYEGTALSTMALPTAPADNTLECTGANKFMGWSASNLHWQTGQSEPADLFRAGKPATGSMGTEDLNFYAVFAQNETLPMSYTKVTANTDLQLNDKAVIAQTSNGNPANGVTGWNGTKDATVSATAGDWTLYQVIDVNSTTKAWKLMDVNVDGENKYIASPGGENQFLYGSTAAYCSVSADKSYAITCNSRFMRMNGTYNRFYNTDPSESNAFNVWKVSGGGLSTTNYVTECCPSVSAPTNLNATPAVDGGTVYWTKSDNATAYEIQVNGGDWTNVGDVNSYTISGIACGGTAVNWNIRALNNCYTSSQVNSSFYTASCNCDGFQFHYRDFSGNWNTNNVCFSAVDGTEHDQLTDEFALPYANAFNVTWQGSPLSDNKTKTTDFQYMGYFLQNSKNFGVNPQNGNMGGALGKMHIYDNSGSDNMYVQWIPTGYTLQMGDGDSWPTTYNFNGKTSAWNETEWFTDLVTVTDAQIGGKIYVGLKTQNGYVWCGTYSESINLNGLRTKTGADSWLDGGLSTSYANKTGKFRIYANSADKNWYVTFVPHLQLTYNANGGSGEMDPSAWHSVEETEAERTISVAANTFTAPSGKAFRGWNKSADGTGDWINVNSDWVLRENISNVLYAIWEDSYPVRYTGTTTGDIDHYSAEGATEHIKPDPVEQGYTFTGWTVTKDGGGTVEVSGTSNNYTFTMPADGVTIHANMSAGLVNLNYFDMGGTSCTAENVGSMPDQHTYGTPTILPAGTKAGYRFDGWHLLSDCSDAAIAELAANVDYANPLAIYAKWTQVQTISFFENGVERTDLAQQAGAGESVTMPAASGIGCGDYQTFLGWVVGTVDETTTVPANIYEAASSFTATGEAVAFHALYTKIVNGDPNKGALGNIYYEKVTSGVTDGVYILVSSHAENPYYYTGQHEASTSTSNYGTVSTTNLTKSGDIVSTPLPNTCHLITITTGTGDNAGKFAMSNGEGYFTATGGNYFNNNISSLANAFVWNLTVGEQINSKDCPAGAIQSADYTTRVLQYNGTGGGRFACYENTQSTYVNLYRATENGTRYYSTTADMKYTWHSGDDDVQYTHVACLGTLTPATPVACDGKTFMGWSKTAVSAIQSTPIDLVDFSTYTPEGDDEFYAVYATQNGGKLGAESNHSDNIGELSVAHSWEETTKICAGGYTTYVLNDNALPQGRSISTKDYIGFYLNAGAADAHFTTYKVNDLKTISFDYITNGAAISYYVNVSIDNENWTTISADGATLKSNTDNTHNLSFNTPAIGDYYVQVGVVYKNSGKYAMITNLTYTTTNRTYWYTDYSTNCTKPATTTLTYDVNGGTEIAPVTETGWVTLPTPTRGCYTFDGWKVTEPDGVDMTFLGGEKYLFNHDATLTAQWSEDTESAAATITFHKGYGHDEVVNVNCHTAFVAPSPEATCDNELTFIGWSTTNITATEGQSTKPTLFNVDEPLCELLGDIDLYPVYKKGVASGTDYTAGATGNFILAAKYDDTWYAIRNNPEVNDGSIAGNVITVNTASTVDYVLEQDATGYIWTVSNNGDNGQRFFDGTYYLYPTGGGTSGSSNLAIGKTGANITNYGWDVTKPAKWNIQATNLTNKTTGRGMGFKTADLTFVQTALSNINGGGTAYAEVRLLPIYAIEGNYFGTPVCPSVATTTGVNYMVSKAGSAIQSCTGVLNVTTMRGSSISASIQEGADKSKFSISVGELVEGKATYTVTYTPSAANETATATIRFDDGTGNMRIADDNEADFTEITVKGCALPDRFVIAALVEGHYLALPENTTSGAKAMSPVEVTYNAQLGGVRGAADSLQYSILSAQDSTLKINSHSAPFYANATGFRSATGAAGASYFWYVTRDGDTYRLRNTGMTGDNFPSAITYNSTSAKFNMIKETTSGSQYYRDLYLLPIIDESGDMMDIVDWNTDQIILNLNGIDPTKGVTASVNGGAATAITEGSHFAFKDTHLDRTYELTTGTLTAGEYVHLNLTYYDSKSNEYNSDRYYRVPYIYASGNATVDKTLTADDDIVVREGKATIESNTTVHNVYVYPGAELVVKSGATLTCANLYVRMKAFAAGEVSGAIEATQTYYTFIIADKQYGLQLALPFESSVETISTTAGDTHTIGRHLKVNYYDAAQRAASGAGNNWKALVGTTLSARTGYEIMSASAYYREYLFPVTYTNVTGEQQMAVSAPTGELAAINNGWNYIASPYTSTFIQSPSGEDDPEDMVKLSELTEDNKTYWQHVMMNIRPAQPFYYQAKEAGKLNFGTILSFEADEPKEIMARKANEPKVQTQWLVLALTNNAGQMDETNLYIHPDKFTKEYEVGYDLEKMLGLATRPQLYSQMECGKLSFNAVSDAIAEDRIPLGYYASQNEKQTFSLEQNAFLTRLEHVYLVDEKEEQIIDLLYSDYEFDAQAGEHTDRFYINCVFKHQTPTVMDEKYLDDPGGPRKFIYNEKLYIESEGVIYDALGKEVTL